MVVAGRRRVDDGLAWQLGDGALRRPSRELGRAGRPRHQRRGAEARPADAFYDGRASAAENWEERTGARRGGRRRPSAPWATAPVAVSPHASGACATSAWCPLADGGYRVVLRGRRPDGAHDLRTELLPGLTARAAEHLVAARPPAGVNSPRPSSPSQSSNDRPVIRSSRRMSSTSGASTSRALSRRSAGDAAVPPRCRARRERPARRPPHLRGRVRARDGPGPDDRASARVVRRCRARTGACSRARGQQRARASTPRKAQTRSRVAAGSSTSSR